MSTRTSGKRLRLLQIFSAKLVLEVFGAAGAIWGFSEAIGLRVESTVWFWRPCALSVGAIFFARWCAQIQDYIAEENSRLFGERKDSSREDDEQVSLALQNEKVYT